MCFRACKANPFSWHSISWVSFEELQGGKFLLNSCCGYRENGCNVRIPPIVGNTAASQTCIVVIFSDLAAPWLWTCRRGLECRVWQWWAQDNFKLHKKAHLGQAAEHGRARRDLAHARYKMRGEGRAHLILLGAPSRFRYLYWPYTHTIRACKA